MPQDPQLVYEKESGTPTYMHSVDAKEAVALGDYTFAPAGGKDVSPEERAAARAKFQGLNATIHPELQTEEQRAEARAQANEEAAMMAGIPPGAQVVVMAPSRSPQARAGATPSAPSASSGAASASTSSEGSRTGRRGE
jgi:hypothetical protein